MVETTVTTASMTTDSVSSFSAQDSSRVPESIQVKSSVTRAFLAIATS